MKPEHIPVFVELCKKRDVIVVSGAKESQIRAQIPTEARFYMESQNGNHTIDNEGTVLWSEHFSPEQERAITAFAQSLRSESIQGLSVVTVVFKEGTDILPARQLLAEKLGAVASQLPAGVSAPTMSPLVSSTMDLLKIGLVSEKMSPMELRTFADWTLKPRLLSVPGVTRCITFGGEVRQLQIQVKPDRLVAHDLGLQDVISAARLATGVRGAGFVETKNQRVLIQTEGQALTAEVLGQVIVTHKDGVPVRLRDVANVSEGPEPKFGDALVMGKPGVLLALASQFGANTLEATHELEEALEELEPIFKREGIEVFPRLHRPATFIEESLKSIKHSLVLGGALVAVVLFIFLGHFRTAFISVTAIPLSLLGAIIVLDRLGVTLNTITLGGLAIAIGEEAGHCFARSVPSSR